MAENIHTQYWKFATWWKGLRLAYVTEVAFLSRSVLWSGLGQYIWQSCNFPLF